MTGAREEPQYEIAEDLRLPVLFWLQQELGDVYPEFRLAQGLQAGIAMLRERLAAEARLRAVEQANTDPEQGVVMHLLKELNHECGCAVCEVLREYCEETFAARPAREEASRDE